MGRKGEAGPSDQDEADLCERAERSRLIIEAATDYAILTTDTENRIASWSPGAEAVFGWTAEEAIGEPAAMTYTPEDRATGQPEQEFVTARDTGIASDVRWHRRKDGSPVLIEGSARALHGPDGTFHGVLKIGQDLTERKRIETRLRTSEERFRTLVQNIRDYAIFLLDARGIITEWTDGAERVKGYTADEVIGRSVSLFYPPEDIAAGLVEHELAQAADTGRTENEGWRIRKGGERFWANEIATAIRDEAGMLVGFTKISRDLTDRRRVEAAVRASEERFRSALDIETVGVLFVTADGRITDANDAFLRMGGFTREDLATGQLRWDELTPPEWMPASRRIAEELAATGRATPYEKAYLRKDGSRWWGLFAPKMLSDDVAVEFVLDITERKRAEAEREAFIDAAAHDLRTPLTALKAQAQLLRRRASRGQAVDAATFASGLAEIEAAADRMVALIGEMMDAAHLRGNRTLELTRAPMDLVELAEAAVAEARRSTTRHEVRVETQEPSLVGEWDRARLARVVANLLDNAVRYSPKGGEIVMRVGRAEDPDGTPWAVLAVRDQGVGIPAADLPHLFERFYRGGNVTGRIAGTGIGLAGAKQIVEQHGGTIAVASEEGRGATFTVRLPVVPLHSAACANRAAFRRP